MEPRKRKYICDICVVGFSKTTYYQHLKKHKKCRDSLLSASARTIAESDSDHADVNNHDNNQQFNEQTNSQIQTSGKSNPNDEHNTVSSDNEYPQCDTGSYFTSSESDMSEGTGEFERDIENESGCGDNESMEYIDEAEQNDINCSSDSDNTEIQDENYCAVSSLKCIQYGEKLLTFLRYRIISTGTLTKISDVYS